MPTASLAFSPVSFTSLTSSHRLPNHILVFITCQSSTSETFTSKSHPVYGLSLLQRSHCPLTLFTSQWSQATSMNSLISTSFINQFRFQGLFSYFSSPAICQESVLFSLSHCHHLSSSHHYPSYYLAISILIFLILMLPDLPSSPSSTLWPEWSFHNTNQTKPFPF